MVKEFLHESNRAVWCVGCVEWEVKSSAELVGFLDFEVENDV